MADKLYFDSSVATPTNVKKDYLFKDATTKEPLVGTMAINTPQDIKINPKNSVYTDNSYTIPEGYHDGTGTVYTGKLSEYTSGTATADTVAFGKTAWVNGEKVVGTLDTSGLAQDATATADDIVYGKTAWVKGSKLTGTIPYLARKDKTLLAGESYTLPYGLSPGATVISAASLASQTEADAAATDIISSKTAWVNGVKITGTLDILEAIKEKLAATDVVQSQVLNGKKFYSVKYTDVATGTMPDHTGEGTTTIAIGKQYLIPEGYYNGQSGVITQSLSEATEASATASNILRDKTAWANGEKLTGTMAYNTQATVELDAGESYTVPIGYHTGYDTISAKSIAKQTVGTATAEDIVADKTAWVNGEKLTGSMTDNPINSKEIAPGEIYYIPEGYHHGTGSVWTKTLKDSTIGTAAAADILIDKTAWVNGFKVTGTMASNDAQIITLLAGDNYIIPSGYHTGDGKIKAATLQSQTPGSATESDILNSKIAWVNGDKITGTLGLTGTATKAQVLEGYTFYNTDAKTQVTGTLKLEGDATEDDVMYGKKFYSNNPQRTLVGNLLLAGTATADQVLAGSTFYSKNPKYSITGTMPNIGQVIKEISADETYTIPKGYHDGTGLVRANGLSPQTPGTADESDIIKDKTAWVNGEQLTGTLELKNASADPAQVLYGYTFYKDDPKQAIAGSMPSNASQILNLDAGESYDIPIGYHTGTGKIIANDLASQTVADAEADELIIGKTAWVNGVKITGTMPDNEPESKVLLASESYAIPMGYHDGTAVISAESLAAQTVADATGDDMLLNKTAWVNGSKITGSIPTQTIKTVRIAVGNSVTLAAGYYPEGLTIYAIYTDKLDLTGTDAYVIDQALYPNTAGYVDGTTLIITAPLET